MSDKLSKSARGGYSTPDSRQQEVSPKHSLAASAERQSPQTKEVGSSRPKSAEDRSSPAGVRPAVAQVMLRVLRIEAGTPSLALRYSPALAATFQVVVVTSGRKALSTLQNDSFDAVHVDSSLPDMDQAEFLAYLRNIAGPVPIVIFS